MKEVALKMFKAIAAFLNMIFDKGSNISVEVKAGNKMKNNIKKNKNCTIHVNENSNNAPKKEN